MAGADNCLAMLLILLSYLRRRSLCHFATSSLASAGAYCPVTECDVPSIGKTRREGLPRPSLAIVFISRPCTTIPHDLEVSVSKCRSPPAPEVMRLLHDIAAQCGEVVNFSRMSLFTVASWNYKLGWYRDDGWINGGLEGEAQQSTQTARKFQDQRSSCSFNNLHRGQKKKPSENLFVSANRRSIFPSVPVGWAGHGQLVINVEQLSPENYIMLKSLLVLPDRGGCSRSKQESPGT